MLLFIIRLFVTHSVILYSQCYSLLMVLFSIIDVILYSWCYSLLLMLFFTHDVILYYGFTHGAFFTRDLVCFSFHFHSCIVLYSSSAQWYSRLVLVSWMCDHSLIPGTSRWVSEISATVKWLPAHLPAGGGCRCAALLPHKLLPLPNGVECL